MNITSSDVAGCIFISILLISGVGPFFGPGAEVATADPSAQIHDCVEQPLPFSDRASSENKTLIEFQQTEANDSARLVVSNPPEGLVLRIPANFESEFSDAKGFDVFLHQARLTGKPDNASVRISAAETTYSENTGVTDRNILIPVPEANTDVHYQPSGEGYVGRQFALLGPYQMTNRTVGCQQIRVVKPKSSSGVLTDLQRPSVINRLETASREISIGNRYDIVTAFISPAPFSPAKGYVPSVPNGEQGGSEIILSSNFTQSNGPIVIHEYVHTTQPSLRTGWVVEGQATYLAMEHGIQAGYITPRHADARIQSMVNDSTGEIVGGRKEPYARGYLFFARLDKELTKRGYELEPVIQHVNEHHSSGISPNSPSVWEEAVENVTGEPIQLKDPYENNPQRLYWVGDDTLPPELRASLGLLGLPLMQKISLLLLPFMIWALRSEE